MDGFEPFEPLFTGRDPLAIAEHVRTIESPRPPWRQNQPAFGQSK
jgi:hypothetical protein